MIRSGRGYTYYALAALTILEMLSLTDRSLIGLVVEPAKRDLGLSDTQVGFVTGIGFAIFYVLLSIPAARLADRSHRVRMASISIGLWGLTMMACLFVTSYIGLVATRIAAAIGETGCKPATYSLLGDYFPEPKARMRAMAIYLAGGSGAVIISLSAGGWLIENSGWREALFLLGLPGLAVAAIFVTTIREPRRVEAGKATEPTRSISTLDVVLCIYHQKTFRHIALGLIFLFAVGSGLAPWQAPFLIRSHGIGTTELGMLMGLISGGTGLVSVLAGGFISARWFAGDERKQLRFAAFSIGAAFPAYILYLICGSLPVVIIFWIVKALLLVAFMAPVYSLMQRLVVPEMRATSMTISIAAATLIGMGLGPQVVGIASDLLTARFGPDALRYGMLIVVFSLPCSAYNFWRASRTVIDDLSEMEAGHTNERAPA